VGYVDIDNLTNRERYKQEGTPQGSIISPLLANIYLHEFDYYIQEFLISEYTTGKTQNINKTNQNEINNFFIEKKNSVLIQDFVTLKKILPKLNYRKAIENNKAMYH